MIKRALLILFAIVVFVLVFGASFFWRDANVAKYQLGVEASSIPIFEPIPLSFAHEYASKKSIPLVPSAAVDIDNDGQDEVFLGGGLHQADALFKFSKKGFQNITQQVNFKDKGMYTSIGVATADFDNNGFQDIMVSREDGLHLYYNEQGRFRHQAILTPINQKSTPTGITLGDIDKDGDLDVFLSTYLKKELMEGQTIFEDYAYGSTSALLLNEGKERFKNITVAAGLDYVHNTFMAILVDIDDDGNLDLIVAHDTGEVRTYRNNGNLTFTLKENPLTKKFAYPMGIAAGDYNNDGRIDFAFSNTGSTLPRFLAKGDIKDARRFNEKWLLYQNNGNFKFQDVAQVRKIANYEFGWGAVFADMNNDGLQDLMVAENYVDLLPNKFFRLPSRLLIQSPDHTFGATEKVSGVKNLYFGITPLISDFNGDGHLDLIWININSPSLAFLNQSQRGNYLKVILPKNAQNIGAKVQVELPSGQMLTEFLLVGEGLASDQTAALHFGLGQAKSIVRVRIQYLNGEETYINQPPINSTVHLNTH